MRRWILALMLMMGLVGLPTEARQSTFYVATNGNNSNDGSIGSPWLTIAKATATLTAGQTALVRAGTYTESNVQFTNSGTNGNVITLKGYPGETAIIDGGFTTSGAHTPVIRLDGPDFITLDNLTLRRGRTTTLNLCENGVSTDITVQNSTIENMVTGDNGANVYIGSGGCDNIVVTNNIIHGRTLGGSNENVGSGFIIFRAVDLTISFNTIYDMINGVYYKHSNSTAATTVVTKNIIHDTTDAIIWSRRDATISHNVVYNTGAVALRVFDASADCASLVSSGNTVNHNTFVDNLIGVFLARTDGCTGAIDTVVTNNVLTYCTDNTYRCTAIWPFDGSDTSNTTYRYNSVFKTGQASSARVNATYYGPTGLPVSVTSGNNLVVEPSFVDYGGDNFKLAGGSSGTNAASDGTDMGAYGAGVTCVGQGCTAPPDPTAPGAPTIGTAVAGVASASVSFSAPASDGGSAITGYTATSSPGSITGTGSGSSITVSGLTNGQAYTFTVTATNAIGTSAASGASNSVTPLAVGTGAGMRILGKGQDE